MRSFPSSRSSSGPVLSADQARILCAAFLRALGIGLVAVILSIYLSKGGLHAGQIGLLVGVGLAGLAAGTFLVSFWADRIGRRRTLILLAALTGAGGLALAFFPPFPAMVLLCFLGMVNAMGRERGALFTLEQAILPEMVPPQRRTAALAWYNLMLDVGLAAGSLLGGIPLLLRQRLGLAEMASYQWTMVLYGILGGIGVLLYLGLSRQVEIHGPTPWHKVQPESRRIITRLSLLFGFDSLAGGFLPAAIVGYWFFRRFGAGEETLGPLFFAGHTLSALSYPAAAWISRRIGLVKTMVFSHTPANLCLIAIPFAPSLPVAVALYLIRESLVEMDVPTRQSYVLAMVAPNERTIASGVTNLTRTAAWSVGPGLAGWAMKALGLGAPLIAGGVMKIAYDAMLYFSFRHLRPPEEQKGPGRPGTLLKTGPGGAGTF